MFKKAVCIFLVMILFLTSSCGGGNINKEPISQKGETSSASVDDEKIRAVWLSVFDMYFLKYNENDFRTEVERVFNEISEYGFNHIFVQVRPSCDAIYESDIFPWSSYVTGKQGNECDFDPLEIMVDKAHENNLKIHAWINPYRVLSENNIDKLSENNPALQFIKDKMSDVYRGESGIYFNPASVKAQKIILDGIREIVKNYDVDGIHIDDYFYPSTDTEIDKKEYQEYVENSGNYSLNEWRMMNVNSFVSGMYGAVKGIDKNIIVSISPSGNIDYNYENLYADVKKWISDDDYCDWIIPQIYFGFENEINPFEVCCDEWQEIKTNENVKLVAGLAVYKANEPDDFAGSGVNEWLENDDIIKREIEMCVDKGYSGYALFSFGYLSDNNSEWQNAKNCLLNNS